MRHEQHTLELLNVHDVGEDDSPLPEITIRYTGAHPNLRDRLTGDGDDPIDQHDIDISFRFQDTPDDPDAAGVIGITNRVTGDYIAEVNLDASDMLAFVTAARRHSERHEDTARYRVTITIDDEPATTYEKRTLLVYSEEGELLRQDSLIPSGVEI